ncbi:outer membrane beta-barrel protein [Sandarakinorhabdus sp. DWP1-3-1]|uniref:outer membrane beta-barrel protein n=1 Tax=Sandarakinorhabdus sp. DWP1-3-1 TaxID=2804627 RepID=UPI003CF02654
MELPRPGYEQRTLRLGATTIASQLSVLSRYDDNIFAVSRNADDDVVFTISPRLLLTTRQQRLSLDGIAYADINQYARFGSESRTGFGARLSSQYLVGGDDSISAGVQAERIVQSRNDPESQNRLGLSPRQINLFAATAGYHHGGGNLELDIRGKVQRNYFLEPGDEERSFIAYIPSVRLSFASSQQFATFIEGYANIRDNDLRVDLSGIDRDMTTFGLFVGSRVSITGKLKGEAGIGPFRAVPADPALAPYWGIGGNAELVWSLRPRTAVTLKGFRGDVATAQVGAAGRTDTSISVRVDQEVRHNLIAAIQAGYLATLFRGAVAPLKTRSLRFDAEYLVDRRLSLFLEASHTRRAARIAEDRFTRNYVGIGIRLKG